MRRSLFGANVLALAALLALALVATVARAQDETAGAEPAIATTTDEATDRAIAERLQAIFAEVEGLGGVEVTVSQGVVRLEGRVLNPELARSAGAIAGRIQGVAVVENAITEETEIGLRLQPVWSRLGARLESFVQFLPLLALGLLVFAAFWIAAGLIARRGRLFDRLSPNPFLADMWRNVVFLAVVLAGGLIAADVMGATALLGSLLGAAGLVGLAIGFAVRDTIENYIATILLSLRQPFAAMDVVEIEGNQGTVARMSSRATVLITPDGNHLRIPNATVFKAVITNFTRNPERRFEFKVGVTPDCDLAHAIVVALDALKATDGVLDTPAPVVVIDELGDFSVVLSVAGWIDQRGTDFVKARGEAMRIVREAFDAAGIAMPVPTYALQQAEETTPREASPAPVDPRAEEDALDTSAEKVVAEKAKAERASAGNLLSDDAAQE